MSRWTSCWGKPEKFGHGAVSLGFSGEVWYTGTKAGCKAGKLPRRRRLMQYEITEAIPLLDEKGDLTRAGYAKRLLPVYDRDRKSVV